MPVELGLTGSVATVVREVVSMTVSDPFDAAYTWRPSGATASSVGDAPEGSVASTADGGGGAGVGPPRPPHPTSTAAVQIRRAPLQRRHDRSELTWAHNPTPGAAGAVPSASSMLASSCYGPVGQ